MKYDFVSSSGQKRLFLSDDRNNNCPVSKLDLHVLYQYVLSTVLNIGTMGFPMLFLPRKYRQESWVKTVCKIRVVRVISVLDKIMF